ncbi:MAG: histidine--tRNA ligase [Defluviitaleaceae bacterium]|nr:histidine--tRNA ligase [Defluviitaleaceae bacterium]MCL2238840.1 histidine--tRNA ligase [Defluviitaleaceae bacterium]
MLQAPKGTHDIYGGDMRLWRRVEDEIRALTDVYGYGEIRTPLFEHTELFLRGVGDTTDIVQKEMYTFLDKGGRSLSLRPELTASAARAYIERGMHNQPQPVKVFYIGPCFRYEKPQAGRYRQHYQFGVEVFGSYAPAVEAEVMSLGYRLFTGLGVRGVRLHVNSIGCVDCRVAFNGKLRDFLAQRLESLCGLCASRYEKNPLRVLDCKSPHCQAQITEAPITTQSLCGECAAHFATLQDLLTRLEIPFIVDPKIVRGLDYYTRTVFEFFHGDGLANGGGGRYDGLVSQLGGTPTGAVGFGVGMERLVLLLQAQAPPAHKGPELFIGHADPEGLAAACTLASELRKAGIHAEYDLAQRSVKAQMKYADKIKARHTTILGATELEKGACILKNMESGEGVAVQLADIKGRFGGLHNRV